MSADFEKELRDLKFELDRTRAVAECQNLMGRYVIRLMTGDLTGCADLWARREDSRVEMAWGVYDGYEGVRACYDKCHVDNLGDMVGILPIHTLTTPVVEVARDGKTARAVWISPGLESHPNEETGRADCNWCWIRICPGYRRLRTALKPTGCWKICCKMPRSILPQTLGCMCGCISKGISACLKLKIFLPSR